MRARNKPPEPWFAIDDAPEAFERKAREVFGERPSFGGGKRVARFLVEADKRGAPHDAFNDRFEVRYDELSCDGMLPMQAARQAHAEIFGEGGPKGRDFHEPYRTMMRRKQHRDPETAHDIALSVAAGKHAVAAQTFSGASKRARASAIELLIQFRAQLYH